MCFEGGGEGRSGSQFFAESFIIDWILNASSINAVISVECLAALNSFEALKALCASQPISCDA